MGLRDKLRKLEREAEGEAIVIPQKDGTVARFPREAYVECLLHEMDRGGRQEAGEDPGPAHPLVEALRGAENLEGLTRQYGTLVAAWVDEDAVIRGEMERSGPPVRETSPGVYE